MLRIAKVVSLCIVLFLLIGFVSRTTTMEGRKRSFPKGDWVINCVDVDGVLIPGVTVTLQRSEVVSYGTDDSGETRPSNEIAFDNFLECNQIVSNTGTIKLCNTRNMVSPLVTYRLFWLYPVCTVPEYDVLLRIECDGYEPTSIDYKNVCFSEEPVTIILQRKRQ